MAGRKRWWLVMAIVLAGVFCGTAVNAVEAQLPVTRATAERAALAAGPRVALARADTAAARAAMMTATARPNPVLAAQYTTAVPQKHITLEIPLDAPWSRGPRIGAARSAGRAARLRYLSELSAARLEVDTTYTRALAAEARLRLSRLTARDADSLRKMTAARRDVGDASDLDVDLATITAGQQVNVASNDSMTYMSTLLTVQTLMGIPADSVAIVLVDTLELAPAATARVLHAMDGVPLVLQREGASAPAGSLAVSAMPAVAAADASLQAAELAVTRERRSVIGLPSLVVGVEFGDPSGGEPGYLPLIGFSIPLPLFNRNQGAIALAVAERDRARAELSLARLAASQRIAEAYRERELLRARILRDQELVVRAQRVAAKSLTAYREGASALPAVLEARRTAREVLGQYIDDIAALLTLQAELGVLTQQVPPQ